MSVVSFQDLPLADRTLERRRGQQARPQMGRCRRRAERQYRKAFVWFDGDAKEDISRVKSHLAKYYDKLGEDAPWKR